VHETADVIIVGAGSTGAAAAWRLAEREAGKIILLEGNGFASGTTGRSCAILRMHYTLEPLARMALASRTVFENFAETVGGDCGFRQSGFLALARHEDVEALRANVTMQAATGIDAHFLTPPELEELVPGMRTDDVGAGAWEPGSGYVDPVQTVKSYVAAAQRHGASFWAGVEVGNLSSDGDGWVLETSAGPLAAGHVVVAAGCATCALVRPFGVNLSVQPIRHTVAVVDPGWDAEDGRPVISDRVEGNYFRPATGGCTLIGSTGAYDGYADGEFWADRWPRADDIAALGERLVHRFPDHAPRVTSGYTSIYDCTPDVQPLLGAVDGLERLTVAVGFSGHGFKLSPAIGDLIADHVMEERTTGIDIDMFRASRFAEGAPIVSPHKYSVPTLG
jgi:glycine/D-amino acid oxidase-like deaminating enzyme